MGNALVFASSSIEFSFFFGSEDWTSKGGVVAEQLKLAPEISIQKGRESKKNFLIGKIFKSRSDRRIFYGKEGEKKVH